MKEDDGSEPPTLMRQVRYNEATGNDVKMAVYLLVICIVWIGVGFVMWGVSDIKPYSTWYSSVVFVMGKLAFVSSAFMFSGLAPTEF